MKNTTFLSSEGVNLIASEAIFLYNYGALRFLTKAKYKLQISQIETDNNVPQSQLRKVLFFLLNTPSFRQHPNDLQLWKSQLTDYGHHRRYDQNLPR